MNLQRFVTLSETQAALNYDDERTVRRANTAAEQMRTMISSIPENATSEISQVLTLLSHPTAGSWAAFCLMDHHKLTAEDERACLDVIRPHAQGNGPDALGVRHWLRSRGLEAG